MQTIDRKAFELGLGLVSIGRVWGVNQIAPPEETGARELLQQAIDLGIRVFDTAPAYASSEERLGRFLSDLDPTKRNGLLIMTKAGEHWDDARDTSFVDHTRDALCRSIDQSLEKLGRVDVLQLHKATRDVVGSPDVISALEHARSCGITSFGASVSDVDAGKAALNTGLYQALQFPFNITNQGMADLIPELRRHGATAIINRPFAMGGIVESPHSPREAFRFIEDTVKVGIVLTGTSKAKHLADNVANFRARIAD